MQAGRGGKPAKRQAAMWAWLRMVKADRYTDCTRIFFHRKRQWPEWGGESPRPCRFLRKVYGRFGRS